MFRPFFMELTFLKPIMNNSIPPELREVFEEWVEIDGYDGMYLTNKSGQIKSLKTKKILKTELSKNGYNFIRLYHNSRFNGPIRIHRLVAKTFIPNPENKPQVNHINGIKTDNRVENLEWATRKENAQHCYNVIKTGPIGVKHGSAKFSMETVETIREIHSTGVAINKLATDFYVSWNTIRDIVKNKTYKPLTPSDKAENDKVEGLEEKTVRIDLADNRGHAYLSFDNNNTTHTILSIPNGSIIIPESEAVKLANKILNNYYGV